MKVVLPGPIDKERRNLAAEKSFCLKRSHCTLGGRQRIESTGNDGIDSGSPTR
jgi:hypothetical protein